MIFIMCIVVVLNFALTLYTLHFLSQASTQLSVGTAGVSDVSSKLTSLNDVANQLIDAIGPKSRLIWNIFPVSIPNLLNEVLRVDFQPMALNITRLAVGVESVMRAYNQGEDMLETAQYASLVSSIAKQVHYLKPVGDGGSQPPNDTANNDMVHMLFSAVFNIIDLEVDSPEPWTRLAGTCMTFVDNFLSVDWSGYYTGAHGQQLQWDINSSIASPFQAIFDYCAALDKLTEENNDHPSFQKFKLTDVLDKMEALKRH